MNRFGQTSIFANYSLNIPSIIGLTTFATVLPPRAPKLSWNLTIGGRLKVATMAPTSVKR